MKSYDYHGVHLFAADGSGHVATLCVGCFKELHPDISIEAEQVAPIFADTEADYYPSCELCGGVFDYISLTQEGHDLLAVDDG